MTGLCPSCGKLKGWELLSQRGKMVMAHGNCDPRGYDTFIPPTPKYIQRVDVLVGLVS